MAAPLRYAVTLNRLSPGGWLVAPNWSPASEAPHSCSLQANCKTREGANHPDRNAQFEHINAKVKAFQAAGQPVISVDTKKKELVGDFKNGGRELRPKCSRAGPGA